MCNSAYLVKNKITHKTVYIPAILAYYKHAKHPEIKYRYLCVKPLEQFKLFELQQRMRDVVYI